MNKKGVIGLLLSLSLIICGGSIIWSSYYFESKMQKDIQSAVEANTFYTTESTSEFTIETQAFESTLVDLDTAISNLDADQEIDKVKTYKSVIEIPQFEIKAYIGDNVEKDTLSRGVGRHESTAELGAEGNCVIAGHSSTTYNCIFNGLENIEVFDTFFVYDKEGVKHTYYVTDKYVSSPMNVAILYDTTERLSRVTLYTCSDKGSQRLVVIGKEFNEEQLADFVEEYKRRFQRNMEEMNDVFHIERVSNLLYQRGIVNAYSYFIIHKSPISSECDTFMETTSGVVVKDYFKFNEHNYDDMLNSIGINIIEEDIKYDLSED